MPASPTRSSRVSVACLSVFVMTGPRRVAAYGTGVPVLPVVLDHRCPVGGAAAAASTTGQHRRQRRPTGEASSADHLGRDLLRGPGRDRLAADAPRLPTRDD